MELFESTGVIWIVPGGQDEHPEAWGDVIEWGALNIGAEASDDPNWIRQRQLMNTAGVVAMPWLHCHSLADVDKLLATADRWGTRYAGVNIEDVVTDNLSIPAIAATLQRWGGNALIITLAWVANGQGWETLSEYPFALEYFPFDPTWNPIFDNTAALVDHACKEIGPDAKITFLYGTYPPGVASPARYDLSVAHSFYTGEDIGSTKQQWDVWDYNQATPFVTCGGSPMPPIIGYQDGITAWAEWFRKMGVWQTAFASWSALPDAERADKPPPLPPKIAARGPNYNENDISTWPWPDKLERTLRILKDDHDAGEV